ncbi:GNAT family N-acetyltransferase [Nocardioides sp. JQ2195]|uniref:GNAT family N-acetyltransferase n=1 Tax=Nocardioides sp. JQ2195 TaxID=2592334 RepID=UPI00143EB17F|nr:GNAT family N-acetyltransferase [Nocardioides sp. JQ2195]QIX26321.1 GNAT family N-acetyltransferase [Nocardioides sp. JQ2195]
MTRSSLWRPASQHEGLALTGLERDANLAGPGHVFAAPFPEDDVLARWSIVLADPDVRVDVVDGPDGLRAVAAYDAASLRQLFVRPESWGRGLGSAGVRRAVDAIGTGATLWVLGDNERARRLYEHLGWVPTGESQDSVWPPHPVELAYHWTGTTMRFLST